MQVSESRFQERHFMASQLRTNVVSTDERDTAAERALLAICKLAGAVDAVVLEYDRRGAGGTILSSTSSQNTYSKYSRVAAAYAETAFLRGESSLRWYPDEGEGAGVSCITTVRGQRAGVVLLLLRFDGVSQVARARVAKLLPDIAVLVEFHIGLVSRIDELEEQCGAAAQVLDQEECGVIALRADHSVIFANEAAGKYLDGAGVLRIRRDFIQPVEHRHAIRFEAALDDMIAAAKDDKAGRRPGAAMFLKRENADRPTLIVMTPMCSATASEAEGSNGGALIYVLQPIGDRLNGLDALCQLYGLSRMEGRLLSKLTGGATLNEAATEMRIKPGTARAYLKHIFAKVGMHRQSEVFMLMSRYLKAMRGDFDFKPI